MTGLLVALLERSLACASSREMSLMDGAPGVSFHPGNPPKALLDRSFVSLFREGLEPSFCPELPVPVPSSMLAGNGCIAGLLTGMGVEIPLLATRVGGEESLGLGLTEERDVPGVRDIVVVDRDWNMLLVVAVSVSVAFESLRVTAGGTAGRAVEMTDFGDDMIGLGPSYTRRTRSGLA